MTCNQLRKYFKRKMKEFKREERRAERKKRKQKNTEVGLDLKTDYKYLLSVMNQMKRAKSTSNKKCAFKDERSNPHMFRNGYYIIQPRCHKKQCRSKDPTPARRQYRHRTIEFGIVFDKYMFDEMKVKILIDIPLIIEFSEKK